MARHAAAQVSWLDTIAAYWTLVVAWFRLALGLAVTAGRHAPIAWPTVDLDEGATEQWADALHVMSREVPMRDEVKA